MIEKWRNLKQAKFVSLYAEKIKKNQKCF